MMGGCVLTEIEAAKVIATLTAAYPRHEIPEETTKLYAKFLQDLEYQKAQSAVIRIITNSRFFPTVAEIREAVLKVEQPNLPLPAEAWEEVIRQMRDIGYVGTPKFSHPLIEKAVQAMGGWISLCQSEDGMVDRAHFLKIFESYKNRHVEEEKTAPVMRRLINGAVDKLPAWPQEKRGVI
jgi:hypothetical protein